MGGQYYINENVNEGIFETWENIIAHTIPIDFDAGTAPMSGAPIISDGHKVRGHNLEQPMMIISNTGSGKTNRFLIPYILSCILSGESIVVTDPKAECLKKNGNKLREMGYKVIVVNLREPMKGDKYNLLKYPARLWKEGKRARADEMFQSISTMVFEEVKSEKDAFWHNTSAGYCTGLCELLCDIMPAENVNLSNVAKLHFQGEEKYGATPALKSYMEMHKDAPYRNLISPYVTAPNETKSSLASVFSAGISKYVRNEEIVDMMSDSTFDVEELIDKKTAVFIVSRDESSVYNGIISSFIDQVYEILIDTAEKKYQGKLPRKISFILDEFANLPAINDINAKITASRSRNISWLLCCQSLQQLNVKYNKDVAKIILGNCNLAYMYSNDIELLNMISDLCGKTTDEFTHEKHPLLSIEQLRHFNKEDGQVLFLLERMRPFVSYLPFITEYPSIEPVEKLELPERERADIPEPNLLEIVKKEKREALRKGKRDDDEFHDDIRPHIPTFEEFMAAKENKAAGTVTDEMDD